MRQVGSDKERWSQALRILVCQCNKKVGGPLIRCNELLNIFYWFRADFIYDALFKCYIKLDLRIA